MRHWVTHFFKIFEKLSKSESFDDCGPAKLVRLSAVLDATEFVVKLLAPRARFAVAKLV